MNDFNHRIIYNSINFINIYSNTNKILNIGDECYFLFTSATDFHLPLIGKGIIKQDRFSNGMNKQYFLELTDVYDSEKILDTHFYGIQMCMFRGEDLLKLPKYPNYFIFGHDWKNTEEVKNNLFRIEGFFVRDSLEQIIELRKNYLEIIKKDLQQQLKNIELLTI